MITNWSRKELKKKAKAVLRFNFFASLGVFAMYYAFIILVIILFSLESVEVTTITLIIMLLTFPVLIVGIERYFIKMGRGDEAKYKDIFSVFNSGCFYNILLGRIKHFIFIYGWSLLLFVPGIFKMYEYRMVSFIMADNPDMPSKMAFKLSKDMMRGNKFNVFKFDVSIYKWLLLASVLLGVATGFTAQLDGFQHRYNEYVGIIDLISILIAIPFLVYYEACNAQLYLLFRKSAIHSGIAEEK